MGVGVEEGDWGTDSVFVITRGLGLHSLVGILFV